MHEFSFIDKYLKPIAKNYHGAFNLDDDAAVVENMVITKDTIVENIHFKNSDPAYKIAQKLIRTNISDLSAMGAYPKYFLLSLLLPESIEESWLEKFTLGIKNDLSKVQANLVGGDTVIAGDKLVLTVTAIGKSKKTS